MASPWNHHERRLSVPLQPEKDAGSETAALPGNEFFSSHLIDYDLAEGDEDENDKEKLECSLYDIQDPDGFDLLSPVDSDSISPTNRHEALQTSLQSETDRPKRLEKEMDGIPSFSASATTVLTGRPATTAVASQSPKEDALDATVLGTRKLPINGETWEMTSDEILALCLQEEFNQEASLEATSDELLTRYLQEEWEQEESLESTSDETPTKCLQEDRSHQDSLRAMSDEALARCMQEQWNEEESLRATNDDALVQSLQEEWNLEDDAVKQVYMKENITGMALELVKGVLQIQEELTQEFPEVLGSINCVARDDMVFMAEATLQERLEMYAEGKPVAIDIGYHFTRPSNMTHIRTGGLLTLQDRNARGIASNFNGSAMGDGVYTADDTIYAGGGKFGDTGLLVARLKGVESSKAGARKGGTTIQHDTYVQGDIVVLRRSSQCLALLEFDRSLLQDSNKAQVIRVAHSRLEELLDRCLNESEDLIGHA